MAEKRRTATRIALGTLHVLGGVVAGGLVGFYGALAAVVARARAGYYIFAVHDLTDVGFEMGMVVAGAVAGGILAYRMPHRLARALLRGLVGLVGGALAGALAGLLLWGTDEGVWSGAVIGSALALLVVTGVALRRVTRSRFSRLDLASAAVVGGAVLVAVVIGLRDPEAVEVPEVDPAPLPPASAVDEVVFLVGDAGATVAGRTPLLDALRHDVEQWSATLARDSAVSVVYAGDLVYPVGVRDADHPAFPQDSSRLWNQIEIVGGAAARRHGTLGLFVPGNHDWGNTNEPGGIERIRNLADQLAYARAAGRSVFLVPEDAAPGPAVRDVRDNIRFVFLDTHWFLSTPSASLRAGFLDQFAEALRTAGDRHVIIVTHHPYRSAGPHGALIPGYHAWGVGYLLKRCGAIVQDLNSPVYEELLHGMQRLFAEGRPPLIFAGGHDHSLQVIERQEETDPAYMLVSGAGSKISSIRTLPGMHYGAGRPGYMTLLFRKDGAVDLFVVAGAPELLRCEAEDAADRAACMTVGENTYEIVYGRTLARAPDAPVLTDSLAGGGAAPGDAEPTGPDGDAPPRTVANVGDATPHEPAPGSGIAWWTRARIPDTAAVSEAEETIDVPPAAVPARILYFRPDSVRTTTGASYLAGLVHRAVLGSLNRHLWDVPVRLPVLDLDTLGGGGVRVEELTGGMQTVGFKLTGADGVTYQFRNIVKIATRGLDREVTKATVGQVLEDQLASQFPLGAMVVAELVKAVGVLVAAPRPVVMPNDERLGPYRPYFAGRVGWIEVRPNEADGDRPGFAGSRKIVGGDEIFEELREDPGSYVEPERYLRARLVDFLVGDWDRHADNWRWARFDDADGRARWEPIPRDRDWAFTRTGGLISEVSPLVFARFVGFSDEFPPLDRLAQSGYRLDHRLLAPLPRAAYAAEARRVQAMLADSVLAAALAVLPPEYRAVEADRLFRELRARRAQLPEVALAFHDLLAETLHVHGYDGVADTVRIAPVGGGQVRVQVWTEGLGPDPHFDRTLDAAQTREVRVFVDATADVVEGVEGAPVRVVVAAPGTEGERDY